MASQLKTYIWMILDESGSMSNVRKDTIGGFNSYIVDRQEEARENGQEIFVSVVKFNNKVTELYSNVAVTDVEPLTLQTYSPNNGTALLDAVGYTLLSQEKALLRPTSNETPSNDAVIYEADTIIVNANVIKAELDYRVLVVVFTDGEENTLPVLPNRTLVTEAMPMMVRPGQTRDFTFDKLVNQSSTTLKSKTLTLEYTQNPAWYAVQALPYIMEFPYECSEQVFSRYYANMLATSIVTKLPAIKQVFDQWKMGNSSELLSNLEKNQELKATLIEETPWLKDAMSETEQKKADRFTLRSQ